MRHATAAGGVDGRRRVTIVAMKLALLTALAILAASPAAQADVLDDAGVLGDAVRAGTTRLRRGVAVGPQVGGFVGYDGDRGAVLHGVGFGLALYTFDVPTPLTMKDRIIAEVKRRARERLGAVLLGGGTRAEIERLLREIVAEVKAELVGKPPRHLVERPRFGVVLEGAVLTSEGGGFQGRLVLSRGVGKASVGVALAVQRAGGVTRFLPGLEASLRLTPVGVGRTPVIELFGRGDVAIADGLPLAIVGGARFTLDIL